MEDPEPEDGHYDHLRRVSPDVIARGLALLTGLLLPLLWAGLPEWPAGAWSGGVILLAWAALWLRHRPASLLCWGLVGVLVTGWHAARWAERELPDACERVPLPVLARVGDLPEPVQTRRGEPLQRVSLRLLRVGHPGCRGPRKIEVYWPADGQLLPGQAWELTLRLRRPWGNVNPGARTSRAAYLARGVHAVGSVSALGQPRRYPAADRPPGMDGLRLEIAGALARVLPDSPATGLLRALAVADRGGITPIQWQRFRQFGVTHLLVISGLHVGMVAALGGVLGLALARLPGLAGQAPRSAALGALLLATLYTSLAGWSVPTTRAWAMLACALLATLAGRSAWAPGNLLAAALLILLINPFAALGAGFWLSFAAVAVLFWLAHWRNRATGWLSLWRAHLFVCLAMFPLGSLWFGGASLLAPLANLLLVPLVSLCVVPLVLAGVLAWWRQPGLAELAWSGAARVLVRVDATMAWLEGSLAISPVVSLLPTVLGVCLALTALSLAVLPLPWTRRALCGLLFLPLLLPWREHRVAAADAVHLLVLDVGQGSAVLIHDRSQALLYDTGSSAATRSAVLPVLRQRGISRLDTLVISHGDEDHAGGLELLLEQVSVDLLWLGPDLAPADFHAVGRASRCRAGQARAWGQGNHFRVLAPAPGEFPGNRNAGSCVLQATLSGQRWLLPGDIDKSRERTLVRYWGRSLASYGALAPHHGSDSSSSWAWLKAIAAEAVVYSHARANPFGHPAPAVVQRHALLAVPTYSTAEAGALEWVIMPGRPPRRLSHRQLARRFWLGD